MACSTRSTSLAGAPYAASCTARFSTGVISLGTAMTMRGRTSTRRLCAFWMKYVSIFSVTLKSAITPSFIGLMATTFPGVRPSISFACRPTATTSPLVLLIATIDGSFTTMPLPCENTSVFAVPRSMARSDENKLNTDLMLQSFLFEISFSLRRNASPDPRSALSTSHLSSSGSWGTWIGAFQHFPDYGRGARGGRGCPGQTTTRAAYPSSSLLYRCRSVGHMTSPLGKETLPLVPDSTPTRTPRPYGRPLCLFLSSRPRHFPVLELFLKCQT